MSAPPPKPGHVDLLCVGRAAVDLYGEERGVDLQRAERFRKMLGGAAANAAVGAARLGVRTGILTRVGADPLGDYVLEQLMEEGVDVRWVQRDPDRLTALVVLAMASETEFPHMFYRNDCADMALTVPDGARAYVEQVRVLLLTGTHLSTPESEALSIRLAEWVREAGGQVCLDLDYRPSLWGAAPIGRGEARSDPSVRARAAYRRIIPRCDLVIGTEAEMTVAAGTELPSEWRARLHSLSNARIVMKRGASGAVSYDPNGHHLEVDGHGVPVMNLLGAGDAFVSAYLAATLEQADPIEALRWGNVAGALVVTRHGCAPATPTRDELMSMLRSGSLSLDAALASGAELHRRVRPQRVQRRPLFVLAMDHRDLFVGLANRSGKTDRDIHRLKRLILEGGLQAFDRAGTPKEHAGFIIDDQFGSDLFRDAEFGSEGSREDEPLRRTSQRLRWLARPIEESQHPFGFLNGAAPALTLRTWPSHHGVKCKILFHPDEAEQAREAKRSALRELAEACRVLERALLVEVLPVAPGHDLDDSSRLPEVLDRFYRDGVQPELWKLPPPVSAREWASIGAVMDQHDPGGAGILLLGNGSSRELIEARLALAREAPWCCGFAFGRTVFLEAAEAWMTGGLEDVELVEQIAARWLELLQLW
ncbi:MAG: 5-dehydro-2-deoxygluconokinase [Myxococcota bacterium]